MHNYQVHIIIIIIIIISHLGTSTNVFVNSIYAV